MAIDTSRRSTLKVMALATGATIAPSFVAAACKHGVNTEATASTTIRGTGLIVSFTEKVGVSGSRQVIVTNSNDQPVTLSRIYPGIVSTPDGQYDLNSLLVNGSREFAPNHATTLTIEVAQTEQLDRSIQRPMRTADSLIHVRTNSMNVNGGEPVTTIRSAFS